MKKWLLGLGIGCLVSALALTLTGCDKDNALPPTPLSKVPPNLIQVSTLWTGDAGDGSDGQYIPYNPAILGSTLVTASYDGKVKAFNTQSGDTLWSIKLPFSPGAGPAVLNNIIVVSGINGVVDGLSLTDGHVLWTAQLQASVIAKAGLSDQFAIIHVHNGDVVALDLNTGKQRWMYNGETPALTLANNSQPVIAGNKVVVGFDNGTVTAFQLTTGKVDWSRPIAIASGDSEISRMIDIVSTPIVQNGVVYAVAYHGNMVALQLDNGGLVWEKPLSVYSNIAMGNGKIFATDETGAVYGIDPETGRVLWVQKDLLSRSVSSPQVINGHDVVVGDYAGYVHWLSSDTGELLARTRISSDSITSQAVAQNGIAFVVSDNGDLAVLKPSK